MLTKKTKIDAAYIRSFNPCESGIINFEKHYPNFNDKLSVLLALEEVPYSDKIWLATKIVDIRTLQQWSVECAENVVSNYNDVYPNDNRVNECIRVTKAFLNGKATREELLAARSAAESAVWSARSAARSAAESAVWSARSAESAAGSAESAAGSADSAADSAAGSADSENEQEIINLSILIALLKNEGL